MHLARVGGALAPADPVLDPPLVSEEGPLSKLCFHSWSIQRAEMVRKKYTLPPKLLGSEHFTPPTTKPDV